MLTAANPFLLKKTYELRPHEWIACAYDRRDWSELSRLASTSDLTVQRNVVHLLEQHIVRNLDAVSRLDAISTSVSVALLSEPEAAITKLVWSVKKEDRQSLFFWRLLAGAFHNNSSEMFRQLRAQMKTDWLVQRFLYPFTFQGINISAEQIIPFTLQYVLSGQEMPWELKIIEYAAGFRQNLLGNEVAFFWAALLMHPFDAIEIVSDCLDVCVANNNRLPQAFDESFERIALTTGNRRLNNSYARYQGKAFKFVEQLSPSNIDLPLPDESKRFLIDCVSTELMPTRPKESRFLSNLSSIRLDKYPNQSDYEAIVLSARLWKFLEGGRFLHGYASTLFMFPRTTWDYECLDFLNLADFFGEANPFIVMSPGVATSNRKGELFAPSWSEIEIRIEQLVRPIDDISDRTWIKDFLFDVSLNQQQGQVQKWLNKIEKYSPIKRNYVCGADWAWLDQVLRIQKVHPFRGNLKAAYVFLLRNVENGDPDHAVVKSILRPILAEGDLESFIVICNEAYKDRSAAFFYYFLTPENLLLTGLAFSEIDALAGRIHALQTCIKRFKFCEIVTEEVYLDELRLLTAAIAYKRLTPSKFEVPWDSFAAEQMIRTTDFYEVGLKLAQSIDEGLYLLGDAMTENTVSFPNRVVRIYTLKNHEWATAYLPLEIIKNFMQDPGYGLEAILGTRIRHNELEHEFAQDIDKVSAASIPGVLKSVSKEIFAEFRNDIRARVTRWNESYIQTPRSERPDGVFQLVPSQEELENLVFELKALTSHRSMVEKTISWIQDKLRTAAERAQSLVKEDLSPAISDGISSSRAHLESQETYRRSDVERIAAITSAETSHTLNRISHWFSWPDDEVVESLSVAEICGASSGRFEREISHGKLRVQVSDRLKDIHVARESVRLVFDVLCEIFFNVLRHSHVLCPSIRVGILEIDGVSHLRVSNLCELKQETSAVKVNGKRFESEIDHVMNVGGSGHKRIAGSLSTAVKKNEELLAVRRPRSFHLLFSLDSFEKLERHV